MANRLYQKKNDIDVCANTEKKYYNINISQRQMYPSHTVSHTHTHSVSIKDGQKERNIRQEVN